MSINYTNENTIIFTLARMNPPTPGHLFLIRKLIEEAIKKNINEVYIILSKTNDNNENPIACPEKIQVLGTPDDAVSKTMINAEKQKMIEETENPALKERISNIRINTLCVPNIPRATPFTPLINLVANEKASIPDLNLILIIGEDRAEMLDSITGYFFKLNNVNSIDGLVLPREEMTTYKGYVKDCGKLAELNILDVPVNAMSASFVRGIVKCNDREKFSQLYSPYLDNELIDNLYNSIQAGLRLPPNSKPDTPPRPLKYRYPMIKGVSVFGATVATAEQETKQPSKRAKTKRGGNKKSKKYNKNKSRKYRKTRMYKK